MDIALWIAIAVILVRFIAKRLGAGRPETPFVRESEPLGEVMATVTEKIGTISQPGWQQMSGHGLLREVAFQPDRGEDFVLSVPGEVYDSIQVGERALLVTQNGFFMDFGGRLGESIESHVPPAT